jgi:hypothetical protein
MRGLSLQPSSDGHRLSRPPAAMVTVRNDMGAASLCCHYACDPPPGLILFDAVALEALITISLGLFPGELASAGAADPFVLTGAGVFDLTAFVAVR